MTGGSGAGNSVIRTDPVLARDEEDKKITGWNERECNMVIDSGIIGGRKYSKTDSRKEKRTER